MDAGRLLEDDHSFGESVPVKGSPVSMDGGQLGNGLCLKQAIRLQLS